MEDDRVILLNDSGEPVGEEEDLKFTDPTGMFSLTEITNSENSTGENDDGDDDDDKEFDESKGNFNDEEYDVSNMIYVAAVIAALGGLLFGYDIGIISGAKIQIQKEIGLSCVQIELIVAMLPVGAFVASLGGGGLVDKFGRRNMIILNAVVFVIGALMISGTSTFFIFLLGRFTLGFAVALSAIAECIYISELSIPAKRGMLVSFNELAITVGILMAFLVNYCLSDVPGGWRIMFSLSVGIAIIQGLAMLFLPQTPQYLMINKKEKQAEQILKRLKLSTNTRQSLANIRLAIAEEDSTNFRALFSSENNMNGRMFIGIGLVIAQQITGQPNVIYYANDIFKAVGFCTEFGSTLASVGLGIMKVAATALSLSLVDKIGRKKCLTFGILVMGLAILTLGIFAITNGSEASKQTCHEFINGTRTVNGSTIIKSPGTENCPVSNTSTTLKTFAFIALITYVCAFSFGFGPITWILLSEIFPPSVKGRAMAVVTAVNWALNFVISASFLQLSNIFTLGGLYVMYSILCVISIVFVYMTVPETKGKSLEDVSKALKNQKIIFCSSNNNNQRRPGNSQLYSRISNAKTMTV